MKDDHEQRLEDLAEKLADVFLVEADPAKWNGAGKVPVEMTKEQRGDRQWDLKNANQLGLLFARALELQQRVKWALKAAVGLDEPMPGDAINPPADTEGDIKRLEREADRLMEKALSAARGR